MDLYRHGFTGKLAEYAARKYKLHRRIPENALGGIKKKLVRSIFLNDQ